MSLSRRALFGRTVAASAPPPGVAQSTAALRQLISARGREALVAELGPLGGESGVIPPPQDGEIRLTSNENPLGPFPSSMAAIRDGFAGAGRYPMNVQPSMADLTQALADRNHCEPANIVLGAGSGEILKTCAQAFTGPDRPLVTASPTYTQTQRVAAYLGAEVRAIPITASGMLDLDTMAEAARGAGLVFFCNPNNPTGTVHGRRDVRTFVDTVQRTSPDTVIHFDEAYHEYVTHPDYESAAGMALEMESVFVSRTFSKCFGLAGMRVGYGIGSGATIARLQALALTVNIAVPTLAGAYAALQEPGREAQEKERNTAARAHTVEFFDNLGYDVLPSETNFIFVNIRRPASEFRTACREHGVGVGRDFAPMEQTHARISIGTMEEMERACAVFEEVLA
jgi:histidinol-phosphate aminotransferase